MGTGSGGGLNFGHTAGSLPDSLAEDSFSIGRSVGAKALNYDIKDPKSGRIYHFVEGTTISNIEVFASKGVRSKLRPQVVEGLTKRFGGKARNWQHVKGLGTIKRGST